MNTLEKALVDHCNLRGITNSTLVYEILKLRHKLGAPARQGLAGGPEDQESEDKDLWNYELANAIKELERRRNINQSVILAPDREIIQAIKDALPVQDVLEQYTQVFYNKTKWMFRCTLHGADRNPSGVIYPDEKRWWCYGCSQGGDIFDAVQAWEHCNLPFAIRKLATWAGIEIRPLSNKPKKGGIIV